MNDHDWQQAYNAGRREADDLAEILTALLEEAESLDASLETQMSIGKWEEPYIFGAARTALAKYREGL